MADFFTADQHYGHDNIRKHCKRPWGTLKEMNIALIDNHNSVVGKNDNVYHLGDFAWKNPQRYLECLNGRHYLILGNHDRKKQSREAGFIWVKDTAAITVKEEYIWLSHFAHKIWNRKHFGVLHLFGHSHGTLRDPETGSCDVGVDNWNYRPVTLNQIKRRLALDTSRW